MDAKRFVFCTILTAMMCLPMAVMGADAKNPASASKPAAKPAVSKTIRKIPPYSKVIECLTQESAALWKVEFPTASTQAAFNLKSENGKDIMQLYTAALEPARTTVRILLPGDANENGAVWGRGKANYVSFLCKSDKPAEMTFHMLLRGKTPGTYQAGFSAAPGGWQKVILPIPQFGLTTISKVAGFAVRLADAEEPAVVQLTDITVGAMAYNDDTWKNQRVSVDLKGDWQFATDPGEQGMSEKWFADTYDDAAWKKLAAGKSWQEQGITHHGWGWYRKKITVPGDVAGQPMTLNLVKIASDDDVWVNGVRVGGFSSEYKYENLLVRSYTVPASLIRYGKENTITLRVWGGHLSFIGDKSGLVGGPLSADFDPYRTWARESGKAEVPVELFDFSEAQFGRPLELLFKLPADLAKEGDIKLNYRIADFSGNAIQEGKVAIAADKESTLSAVVPIDAKTSRDIYLAGRLRASLLVEDSSGNPIYSGMRVMDRLSFAGRDEKMLPALAEKYEQTPYGNLKLVDEIDCAADTAADPHPYMQSGFDKVQLRCTPGSPVKTTVTDILGKKAREVDYGWFAYRLGRGGLKPHATYLVRIEYPEDKPRFAPIEIQTGQNYSDVGWKNGVGADDVYENWPLSKKWQWYDVIVPLDDQTTGTGGTGTASSRNGFWIYFMNKLKPNAYYTMWSGGPAVARIKLYEIDPEKNAPAIQLPKGLPNRLFSFDWERQADHDPADFCRYAKLMGYNGISPIVLKWFFANYGLPQNGYTSVAIDSHDYWSNNIYDPASGKNAEPAFPGARSQHERYLDATKQFNLNYIPRIEWGGSQDLPVSARAVDPNGQPTKPNRFAPWCSDLLQPATWDDYQKYLDTQIKPFIKDNPQMTGILWRIRCDRLPVSYSKYDIELFSKETGTPLPKGGEALWGAWASGDMKVKYDNWWHQKRADFHAKVAELLKSYRSDMTLYYYNWDNDKFSLILPSTTAWAFLANVIKAPPAGGRAAYEKDIAERSKLTAADYIEILRTGNFGSVTAMHINRADYGIRPELYKNIKGVQIFAPVDFLCYAIPEYFNYFQTADGLAMSHVISYDEVASRTINPKYEGNMITPAGAQFSMALELLAYFDGDARTLNYTVYTYGRGFADAHRRFAQAFLALPAVPASVVNQPDKDLKIRTYASPNGTYLGIAYKGYAEKTLSITVPGIKAGSKLRNLVTNEVVPVNMSGGALKFEIDSLPMSLHAYLIEN